MFAGQLLKYYGAPSNSTLAFRIGERRYPIRNSDREIRVIGQWNDPMPIVLENPEEIRFGMKMAVVSSQNPDEIITALRHLRDKEDTQQKVDSTVVPATTSTAEPDSASEKPVD